MAGAALFATRASGAPRRLTELLRYAAQEGLGQVPEVFDGGAPQRAAGCIAQAWNVAELLRALLG
jgi:glycogen debranching enzyme